MQKNILDYLEKTSERFPQKTVYRDEASSITFSELKEGAMRIGSFLAQRTEQNSPVVILSDKTVRTPMMYLGVLYSGCFYVPVGVDLPEFRLKLILDLVQADVILIDPEYRELVEKLDIDGTVVTADEALQCGADQELLAARRAQSLDTDPAYVIFTSGSTGKPKGVIEPHRAVIDYIDVFADTFQIDSSEVFGNQAPLDYIAAIRDLYLPLKTGASAVLIPKKYFSIPAKLFDCLNENQVTTICWVVSAFCLCNDLQAFEHAPLQTVRKVFFTGAVMPARHLRLWQQQLPEALFVNHYGPTEITASCTYYIAEDEVSNEDVLPIGIPFDNTGILLLTEDGREVTKPGERGEICVRGTSLALGYYGDREKTAQVFVDNPLNDRYGERIYKTGDIGSRSEDGLLWFHGRMDSQIKHAGHRIELSEIEGTARMLETLSECSCLYNQEKEQLWLFFTGRDADKKELALFMRQRLPGFMIPRRFVKLEELPRQFNGKVDLEKLRAMMR